jgi:hypothetical protein
VMQVGVKTVFGVRELVSSFLVTKCSVKCHLATHFVSFVAARGWFHARIVKGQASEHAGLVKLLKSVDLNNGNCCH